MIYIQFATNHDPISTSKRCEVIVNVMPWQFHKNGK